MSMKNSPTTSRSNGDSPEKAMKLDPSAVDYDTNPYFSEEAARGSKVPAWMCRFRREDLKELFKCCLAVWVATILIFINPALRALGQATFFASLVQFFAPPSGIVFVQLMAGLTVIVGCCLAWAWGVITMKAALATRPAAEVQAKLAALASTAAQTTTYPEQASGSSFAQVAIYKGYMLDARVSVTYFTMLCLFIYFMARLRIAVPKLTLLSIFSIIISDTFLTIGPLLPSFSGKIPQVLIKPAAVAIAIGLVCNILIFPKSTSTAVLKGMQAVLQPMRGFLDASSLYLRDPMRPMHLEHVRKTRREVIDAYKALEAEIGFLGLDATIGRWNADDISSLKLPLRHVLTSFLSMMQFYLSREELRLRGQTHEKSRSAPEAADIGKPQARQAGNHQLSKIMDFRERVRHPDADKHSNDRLKLLSSTADKLIATCHDCLESLDEGLRHSGSPSWFGRTSRPHVELHARHEDLLQTLRTESTIFSQTAHKTLWASCDDLFDSNGQIKTRDDGRVSAPIFGAVMAMILEKKITSFAHALSEMVEKMITLEQHRLKTRMWLPTKIQKFFEWVFDNDSTIPGSFSRTVTADQDAAFKSTHRHKRGPRKQKPVPSKDKEDKQSAKSQLASIRHRVGGLRRNQSSQYLLGFLRWLSNTEGLYALRVVVVTIALGVPAVLPASAGFYYREKGLWAIIMAQTGLVEYTADFVFGFAIRLVGTVLGGVIGMVVWYIGAGSGRGNPYGMAAAMAVVTVVLMYLRLFAPPIALQGVILSAATVMLVMAYSWVDTHIPSYGNPGVGYTVFWRRTLLVMIGMLTNVIVILFPRPPSANRHYRQLLSESLQSIKDRYALFASNCHIGAHPPSDTVEVAQNAAIDSAEVLMQIAGPIQLVRFEFSSSPFDANVLSAICRLCSTLNLNVTQLLMQATTLKGDPKTRFVLVSGALNEELVGEIMAVITLAQHSLRTGEPLPAVLPVPLLARSMEMAWRRLKEFRTHQHSLDPALDVDITLTRDLVAEDGFRQYCESLGAFIEMMSNLDELVLIVKRAVGETSTVDFMHRDVEAAVTTAVIEDSTKT